MGRKAGETTRVTKICEWCGIKYEARKRQKFCEPICAKKSWAAKKYAKR